MRSASSFTFCHAACIILYEKYWQLIGFKALLMPVIFFWISRQPDSECHDEGKQLHATEFCFQINDVMGISVEKVYSLFKSVIHLAQFPVKEFQPQDVGNKQIYQHCTNTKTILWQKGYILHTCRYYFLQTWDKYIKYINK